MANRSERDTRNKTDAQIIEYKLFKGVIPLTSICYLLNGKKFPGRYY